MKNWEKKLDSFFGESVRNRQEGSQTLQLAKFIQGVVGPAFDEVRDAMARHGREATIRSSDVSIAILIYNGSEEEMSYRVQGRMFPTGFRPYAEVRFRERKGLRYITVESLFRRGSDFRIEELTKEEIIDDLLDHYMRRVKREDRQ